MATPSKTRRRWLQFSLRGFLVVLTAGCLFSGWAVDVAQKQRAAVEAIEAIGGVVQYDWQGDIASWESSPPQSKYSRWGASPGTRYVPLTVQPSAPRWLRHLLGEHFFQDVNGVIFRTRQAGYSISGRLIVVGSLSPGRDRTSEIDSVIMQLQNLPDLRAIYLQGTEETISEATENRLKAIFPHCRVIRESVVTATP